MANSGHTLKAFDEELEELRVLISEMGGLAELANRDSIQALTNRDLELAAAVIERDARIDELESEVERRAISVMALRAPLANDLREVVAALKISSVVERIGDYAKNIAKRVPNIENSRIEPLSLLPEMARISGEMVTDALDAFDLLEAALTRHMAGLLSKPQMLTQISEISALIEALPTHTVRSENQLRYQQFSTPADLAALSVILAQPLATDIVLEPSAGHGALVATLPDVRALHLNEIDPRRRE